jgi:DNA polymerase-1
VHIVIADCETDNLLANMTKLHCIQIGDADGDDSVLYRDAPGYPSIAEGVARLKAADRYVFHNGVGFDHFAINKILPGTIELGKIIDTLILARLKQPEERDHRLETWGKRTGTFKGEYTGDYQEWTQEFEDYSRQDIHAGRALWHAVKDVMDWPGSVVEVEHKFAHCIALQEQTGFRLDIPAAEALAAEFRGIMADLDAKLQAEFRPIKHEKTFVPKASNSKLGYKKGVPCIKRWTETFDPGSRQHCARRLQALGWKPKEFGKDGVPTVDDDVLQAMPYPIAKVLAERFTIEKKLGQLADGKTGWLKVVHKDGRVRGRVNSIGCAPGRCSHSNPNLGNVNKQDKRMRGVWIPRDGWKLVGIDAEGLQARLFAHYVTRYDGGEFATKLVNGSKKTRTDVHSANLVELAKAGVIQIPLDAPQELWDIGRDGAKRCLYATWFGAQDPKLGWTAKDAAKLAGLPVPRIPDKALGGLARGALMRAIKGYDKLVKAIQEKAKARRYLLSPLGRRIPVRSMHSALVFLEQGGEADVMKLAETIFFFDVVPKMGWVYGQDFTFVAHVHDERQIEARPEIAAEIGELYASCIATAGVVMNLRCPLAGSPHVGNSWADTH